MTELQIFQNETFGNLRIMEIDGEPWFVGKDVAEALGYAKARNAINSHVDVEDKKDAPIQGVLGGTQTMTIINESGLYALVLSSKLPQAKQFKRWVTHEVIPSIRKHQAYMTPEKIKEILLTPETIITLATALKEEQEKNIQLETQNLQLTAQNKELKKKADYVDTVASSETLSSIRETAKVLNIPEKKFVEFMLNHGYLFRDGNHTLLPYSVVSTSARKPLFKVVEYPRFDKYGNLVVSCQTKITTYGKQKLLECYKASSVINQ